MTGPAFVVSPGKTTLKHLLTTYFIVKDCFPTSTYNVGNHAILVIQSKYETNLIFKLKLIFEYLPV